MCPRSGTPDGLAISSRNAYLSAAERAAALALPARAGGRRAGGGRAATWSVRGAPVLQGAAAADPPLGLDYLALVDPVTFDEIGADYPGPALLLVAARAAATRLIDNIRS